MNILPTAKTVPVDKLGQATILMYGTSKCGKTTTANDFPDNLFLATEAGQAALSCYKVDCPTWEQFIAACNELCQGNHSFRTVTIDTVDMLFRICADHVCKQHGVRHESEVPHGKLYGLIKMELQRVLTHLSFQPFTLILVSHSQDRKVDTRVGEIVKASPTVPESFRQVLVALVDIILFCDLEVGKAVKGEATPYRRVFRTKPSPVYDAGDRFGILPETLTMSYDALRKAFDENMCTPGEDF